MNQWKQNGVEKPACGGKRDDHHKRGLLATHLTNQTKMWRASKTHSCPLAGSVPESQHPHLSRFFENAVNNKVRMHHDESDAGALSNIAASFRERAQGCRLVEKLEPERIGSRGLSRAI